MNKYEIKIIDGIEVATLNREWKKEIQNKKYEFFLKESNIPFDYYNLSFEHASIGSNKDVVDKCYNYINNYNKNSVKNLYLYGLNSSGKTTAMCSIGKEAIRKGLKVKFILSSDLLSILQKTSGYNANEDFLSEKRKLESCDIILIDELFDSTKSILWKGESKNLIVAEWDSFLRHTLSNGIKIICTSNILPFRISSDYSQSLFELVDRNFEVLEFTESVKQERKRRVLQ